MLLNQVKFTDDPLTNSVHHEHQHTAVTSLIQFDVHACQVPARWNVF